MAGASTRVDVLAVTGAPYLVFLGVVSNNTCAIPAKIVDAEVRAPSAKRLYRDFLAPRLALDHRYPTFARSRYPLPR